MVLNAESTGLPDLSFDLVVVQDGLHHLQNPVGGFTEMLRIARVAVIMLEPHEALVGRLIGTQWERDGAAVNYVFRWTRRLVEDVASSFLGPDSFKNLSFSFWHHNPVYGKIGTAAGGGKIGLGIVKTIKIVLDTMFSGKGNMMCGLIIKR